VRPAPQADVDFEYLIHNADGGEVEQCGNGSRCFVRFVREQGLTDKSTFKVQVHGGVITLSQLPDGSVQVDMGPPVFDSALVPFDAAKAVSLPDSSGMLWRLALTAQENVDVAVLSMGNPHAVVLVDDVDKAHVSHLGPLIEKHAAFPKRVNAGFLQVLSRTEVKLRVYERGAGETLACGTGACAAVVAGIQQGWLDAKVEVHTRGGVLTIEWQGEGSSVMMSGPATTVFTGEMEIPE
jgi:diaminopimelate epimerase